MCAIMLPRSYTITYIFPVTVGTDAFPIHDADTHPTRPDPTTCTITDCHRTGTALSLTRHRTAAAPSVTTRATDPTLTRP